MGNIAVGKDDLVHGLRSNNGLQLFFRPDRDPVGIEVTCKFTRIRTSRNVGYLRSRKGHNSVAWVIAIDDVEVMEVAAGRSHDDHLLDTAGAIFHRGSFLTADFCHSWPKRFWRSSASDSSIQQANRMISDRRHIVGLYLAEPMLTAAHHTEEACP